MKDIREPTEPTSELMRKLAFCEYEVWLDNKTLEPFIVDPKNKIHYTMTEEVSYWREYMYRYINNRANWALMYNS